MTKTSGRICGQKMLLAILLCVQISTNAMASTPVQFGPKSVAAYTNRLIAFRQALTSIRNDIDRSYVDTEALLDTLEYDANRIIQFVKQNIRYEVYDGLLRGPVGTLLSKAGNSLDQSVLLAKLLKDAGYDARVVEGALPGQNKRLLVAQIFEFDRPTMNIVTELDYDTVARSYPFFTDAKPVDEIARDVMEDIGNQRADVAKVVQSNFDNLKELISSDAPFTDSSGEKNYYWVEYRDGQVDWVPLHPAFVDSDEVDSRPQNYLSDVVPQHLSHRFSFRLEGTFTTSNEPVVLFSSPEWATGNLVDEILYFSIMPVDSNAEPLSLIGQQQAYENADFFWPVLDGVLADEGFRLNGQVVPPEALSMFGGIFKTQSEKLEQAIGAMDGKNPAAVKPEDNLEALEIVYLLEAPHADSVTFRRDIWRKGSGLPIHRLADTFYISAYGGDIPLERITVKSIERQIKATDLVLELLRTDDLSKAKLTQRFLATFAAADFSPLDLIAIHLPDNIGRFDESHYHATDPNIIVARYSDSTSYVDIVSNRGRGYSLSEGVVNASPAANSIRGIRQSAMESLFVNPFGTVENNGSADLANLGDGSAITILRNRNELQDRVSEISESYKSMQNDLDRGYILLFPKQAEPPQAWWRIDPRSGETLSVLYNGAGASPISEYKKALIVVAKVAGLFGWATVQGGLALATCLPDDIGNVGTVRGVGCLACAGFAYATSAMSGLVAYGIIVESAGAGVPAAATTVYMSDELIETVCNAVELVES